MRLFALAFVLGAFLLQNQRSLPGPHAALLGVATALACAFVAHERRIARAIVVVAAGLLLGFGYSEERAHFRLAESLPLAMEGADVAITGIVSGLPQPGEMGTRFLFDVEEWGGAAPAAGTLPWTISLAWYAQGDEALPRVDACERWRFTVRLKRPRGFSNPHGFDFEAWALERGIRATGYVRAVEARRLSERVDGWCLVHRWRGAVREAMQAHLGDAPLAGVLVALAIGDQDSIPESDWETFWRTGVGHLMSISGLHITMLAALAFAAVAFAWVRIPGLALRLPARKAAAVAGVATAAAYTLMTGYAVPAQRTLVMLSTVAACVLADRHGSPSRVLALAVLAVLALDPWAVLAPGFWLSFGAVASIFFAVALRTGKPGRLHAAVREQLAVTLVMLPMLVALFQQVSLVSPLANAFAIPLVSLGVVPLTLAGAFLPFPILLDAAHGLMSWVMVPLEWLASLPMATLESHAPEAWTVACAVVGALWLLAPRGFPMRACAVAWIVPLFAVLPPAPGPGEAWIDVLDVGNGLAVVVRTARHALTYDAGPSWNGDADSGNRIVVPFIRGEGIARLDGLVISHADDDHSGGAASIAMAREAGWMLSPLPESNPLHGLVQPSLRCEAGGEWRWDGVQFQVLHPAMEIYAAGGRRKENDRGCVLKVSTSGGSMLLAADVEARSEREMLAREAASLASDVLLVPHHGSKTSSTPAFIDAVAPRLGILSVGYRNRFRHPSPVVVERYVARGVELHRTDAEGALRIALPAERSRPIRVVGQEAACRYWSARPCAP
ncbi:MAG TPA: DNA internalization-related competence protein ComEC/Rec2 [Usitatibacter sp.]|nr:DNA internalization-related competence protein ComEC/Rec2 [Usitatibacter sp.]